MSIPYPFEWMALCPLFSQAVAGSQAEEAIRLARKLVTPPHQRLAGGLTEQLEQAIALWDNAQSEAAIQQLAACCTLAAAQGYA